ncbi:hypothetical protein V8C26DRAFT_280221 [Trichoderma gracile]
MSFSSPEASTKMECLGNYYSHLSSEQQSQFYNGLLKRCHSLEVLRQERVVLPNEDLPPGTPIYPDLGVWKYAMSPIHHNLHPKRKAVVIACEFGIAESRRNEPLAVSLIDCLTGETLCCSLVDVSQQMLDWRDHIHGIDWCEINDALRGGLCLRGWRAARDKLFEYIDDETILVGYSIRLSLELLRVFHTKIVDSQVLLKDAVFPKGMPHLGKGRYKTPLLHVCNDLLRITLRQGIEWDVGIHDPLENTLATREIALKCIRNPAEVEAWAQQRRVEFWKLNPMARLLHHDNSTSEQTSTTPSYNQVVSQQAVFEQVVPAPVVPAPVVPAPVVPAPVVPAPVVPAPVVPKPVVLVPVVPAPVVPAPVVPKQDVPKQDVPKQVVPAPVVTKQVVPKQVATKQVVPKQVVPKQVIPEQASTKQSVTKKIEPKRIVPHDDSTSDSLNEKYEAGYKTGFESGFRMGYDRGLEKANKRQKTSTEEKNSNESHSHCRYSTQNLIDISENEDDLDNRREITSPRGNHDDDGALATGGLFAELMKDERIRKMAEASLNHGDTQAGARENEGSMSSTDSWETCRSS